MSISDWIAGARPKTLPAAVAPVLAGVGVATWADESAPVRAVLAAGVALALQVGVNYANDYSDGIRGTDDARRVGPRRLVGSGSQSAKAVKYAAFASFGVAAALGLALLSLTGQWWLIAVGAAAIVAAWFYTGGPSPYGYAGLGEVFVFVFFGLVATLGTVYTQIGKVPAPSWALATGCGAMSVALLMINNIRDRRGDERSGKKTLAVRLGNTGARRAFAATIGVAAAAPLAAALLAGSIWPAFGALALLPAGRVVRDVLEGATGTDLIDTLAQLGKVTALYGLVVGAAMAIA